MERVASGRTRGEDHAVDAAMSGETETFVCTKCRETKTIDAFLFYKSGARAGQMRRQCKVCSQARQRARYWEERGRNTRVFLKGIRAYYHANKEKICARGRALYAANRAEKLEYRRKYREAHRERLRAYDRGYYAAMRRKKAGRRGCSSAQAAQT